MNANVIRLLALVALAVTAGCASTDAGQTSPDDGDTPSPTTVHTTQPNAQTLTTEYPYGTQFVSADRVNESVPPPLSSPESVTFENLSTARQDTFERALAEGRLTFGPDETNPFDFNFDGRPQYVRYDGRWYYVRVVIV